MPVVVITGDTCIETELSVLASGAEDYLVKHQISGPALMQAIRAALSTNKRSIDRVMGTRRFRKRLVNPCCVGR